MSVDDNVYHIGICTDALVGQPVGESSSAIKLSKADPSKRIVLGDFTNSKFMSEGDMLNVEHFPAIFWTHFLLLLLCVYVLDT